jgi:hypothetical protein
MIISSVLKKVDIEIRSLGLVSNFDGNAIQSLSGSGTISIFQNEIAFLHSSAEFIKLEIEPFNNDLRRGGLQLKCNVSIGADVPVPMENMVAEKKGPHKYIKLSKIPGSNNLEKLLNILSAFKMI